MTAPYAPGRRALTLKALASGAYDGKLVLYYRDGDPEPLPVRIEEFTADGDMWVTTTGAKQRSVFVPVADVAARRIALRPSPNHTIRGYERTFIGLVAWCGRCDFRIDWPQPTKAAAAEAFRAQHLQQTDTGTEAAP